jgi:hypothetical protein
MLTLVAGGIHKIPKVKVRFSQKDFEEAYKKFSDKH